MKHPTNKTLKTIAYAAIAITTGATLLHAGEAPWISPNYDYVIGVNKTLDVYCGDGASDDPDATAPCPPWTLSTGTEVWNWILNGPGSKSGNEDQITVTATGVGDITVSVNRNDTYSDETQPTPTTDSGTVSPDSETLTIHSVQLVNNDPNKKWYFFNNPQSPIPVDVEECHLTVQGSLGSAGSVQWTASASIATFTGTDPGGSGQGTGMDVIAKSSGTGDVSLKASWGSQELGSISHVIRYAKDPINVGPYWEPWNFLGVFIGWKMEWTWLLDDNKNAPIEAGIGINEEFYNYQDVMSNHNWPKASSVSSETTPGGFTDSYSVRHGIFSMANPTPVYYDMNESDEIVYTRMQKYRIGSREVGEGQLLHTHLLKMCRGEAKIE